jgi:hypothetical protein
MELTSNKDAERQFANFLHTMLLGLQSDAAFIDPVAFSFDQLTGRGRRPKWERVAPAGTRARTETRFVYGFATQ